MARGMGLAKVWLQANSMIIVGMLRGSGTWNPIQKPLIMQCKEMLEEEGWKVKVSHCYCKVNCVADRLANLGIDKEIGVIYFNSPSKKTIVVLHADIIGVAWPRTFK